ncbi:hypothetical protein BN1708_019646, partial [Verticillium longisporum]
DGCRQDARGYRQRDQGRERQARAAPRQPQCHA